MCGPAEKGYARAMTEFDLLQAAAFKTERAAGRRLAERTGVSQEAALRRTLELAAGSAGLAHLLARRAAERAHASQREALRQAARTALATRRNTAAVTPWRAWFDGSAHPNPGRCGIGGLLEGPDGQRIEISTPAGHGNSSEAEYLALIAVLRAAVEQGGVGGLTIHGDSRVVIDDITGPEPASAVSLRDYRRQALVLLAQLDEVNLRWIPRHKNHHADALSQRAVAMFSRSDD